MQKITRTIVSTLVTAKVLNPETEEFDNLVVSLAGKVEDEAKVTRLAKIEVAKTNYVFVKIVDIQHVDALYEMPLADFIAHATLVTE